MISLEERYVDIITERADSIRRESGYAGSIIRDDIFKIIRKKGRILFYPLDEEESLDGFHIIKIINDKPVSFVYINTAKPFEKNIFCGAHELGHIYEIEKDIEKSFPGISMDEELIDRIMNRFAAELLMPKKEFIDSYKNAANRYRTSDKGISGDEVMRIIASLMDFFYVPYKAVVYRLYEINFFTEAGMEYFEKIEKNDPSIVDAFIIEGDYTRLRNPSRIRQIDGLSSLLSEAEKKGIFSNSLIERLRDDFQLRDDENEVKKIKSVELSDYIALVK